MDQKEMVDLLTAIQNDQQKKQYKAKCWVEETQIQKQHVYGQGLQTKEVISRPQLKIPKIKKRIKKIKGLTCYIQDPNDQSQYALFRAPRTNGSFDLIIHDLDCPKLEKTELKSFLSC